MNTTFDQIAESIPTGVLASDQLSTDRFAIVAEIIEEMRPYVQKDGGDMELVKITGNRAFVRLSGACTTCSHASQTLGGVRRRVMERLGEPLMVLPMGPE
jgi:Fe-S cluster biogenesis protein NfuA